MIGKKLPSFLCAFLFVLAVRSQPYGNEWIDYSRKYYRFSVYADGIYRIDSLALANSGIPVGTIDPRNLQVFGRGAELYSYVAGENDGVFNGNDYVEFYARRNDGFLDSLVYGSAVNQPNPYYSLFNDTAVYFLTWNSSLANLRLTVVSDTAFSQHTPAAYFFKKEVLYKPNDYFDGPANSKYDESPDPEYDPSEGWFDNAFYMGGSSVFSFNTPNVFPGGPNTGVAAAVVGASNDFDLVPDHELQIEYQNNSGSYISLADSLFDGYKLLKFNFSIPSNQLGSGTAIRYSSVYNAAYRNDNRTAVCYTTVTYPHTTDMEAKSFFEMYVPDHISQAKSYFIFSNFNAPSASVILYDVTNNKRIRVFANGSDYRALIPNSGAEKFCYLADEGQVKSITSLRPVSAGGLFTDYSAIPGDSMFVMITHKTLLTEAMNYKTYRSGAAGGGYNCILADIDELYDQFAYGIQKHPLSVRRFADFLMDNASSPPSNLFLLGKSIKIKYCRNSSYNGDYAANYATSLVPSYGEPACDNLFTAKLNGSFLEPAIPTGRLSARNSAEVSAYLDKVIEYESQPAAEWMKQVIHFGGGSNSYEQSRFRDFLRNYEDIIEDTSFGGSVHTVLKTSPAPISSNISDDVKNKINSGVSLITFFGHASGNSFDQNIDLASSYNNSGKYPLILANSCFAGDIHQPYSLIYSNISEDFVLAPEKGAIGFIANVNLGLDYALNEYSHALYRNIGYKKYHGSIGQCIRASIADIMNFGSDPYSKLAIKDVCLQMTLNGDPSVKINSHLLPDYYVDNNSVFFSPLNITTEQDSFHVHVVVANIGKARDLPVNVEIKRIFPDGSSVIFNKAFDHVYYKDTLVFTLAVDKESGAGLNNFEVRVDPLDQVQELSELNNNIMIPPVALLINSGDIIPVYPYKYAIVPDAPVILKASTGDPFAPQRDYIFEIDTTDFFTSPFKRSQSVMQSGGIVNISDAGWLPADFQYTDSTVYYWRARRNDPDTLTYPWRESSFQYIKGKSGWGQSHFYQFKGNDYVYMQQNIPGRKYDFVTTGKKLTCNTYGQIPPDYIYSQLYGTQYKLDLVLQESAGCQVAPALMVAVIDPITLEPWGKHWIDNRRPVPIDYNPTHSFGNLNDLSNCRNALEKYFIFQTQDPDQMAGMKNMLENAVPDGYYILVYSWVSANFKSWADTSLYTTFEKLGSDSVRYLPDTIPYIFFAKKGDSSTAIEVIGHKADEGIELSVDLTNNSDFGVIASGIVGPASGWDSLSWRQHTLETITGDSARLTISGITQDGTELIIKDNLPPDSANLYLKGVSANEYPGLKLSVYLADDSLQTPPQMDKWQVFYTPVPEMAVSPNSGYTFYNDTLQEGDSLRLTLAVKNISEYDFTDSVLISYWIEDNNKISHPGHYELKPPPFRAGQIIVDTIVMSTVGFAGNNKLWFDVNPLNTAHTQPEQYHFNNIAVIDFYAGADKVNPLLDVTFDGQHILNGDIVSAKPDILIQLKDENKFLALNDTAAFAIYLKSPSATGGSATDQRVYFGPEMTFVSAVLPNNSCKINYKPSLHKDGIYQLTVQAKDKSHNLSGAIDYKITFEVINKSTITEVLNYPNPFTSSTRFVFTITGSQAPDYFKIQIMTVTGKVVKEISKEELGYLHIGRNITDYAWDGTDDFGDRLANGVYLYRVLTQLHGSSIEKRETAADDYFKKGWGKMYLMR